MCLSLAYDNSFSQELLKTLADDLVERLQQASKYEEAGDLLT